MYKSVLTALLLLAAGLSFGRDDAGELTRTFSDAFDVSSTTEIVMRLNDADLNIETWDQNRVEASITVTARGSDQADLERFMEVVAPTINQSPTHVNISNELCFRKMVVNNNVTKIWMQDGGPKIQLNDFQYTIDIKVPKGNRTDLKAKYCKVKVGDLTGDVALHFVDCDVNGGALTGSGRAKLTYGDASFGDISGLGELELFEMDFHSTSMGDVDLNSRYSDARFGTAGKVELQIFEGDLEFDNVTSLEGKLSYGDIHVKDGKTIDLTLFEVDFWGGTFEEVELEAKYSKIEFDTVAKLETEDFENRYEIDNLGAFESESKYSKYEFDRVTGQIDFEAFESNLEVDLLEPQVSDVRIKGKYMDIELETHSDLHYHLDMDLMYTKVNYPRGLFSSEINTSKDEIKSILKSNKSSGTSVTFTFDCFEGSIDIITS